MRTFSLIAATTLALASSLGCTDPDDRDVLDCTAEAVVSVNITVEEAGEAVDDATVQYSVDGGAFTDCEDWGGTWACGIEEAGEFLVRVEAPGRTTIERGYNVSAGECHVSGVHDTITLESELNCTEEARPSVILSVTDGTDAIADATARWRPETPHDEAWEDCASITDGFACGTEWSGTMEIEASAPGFDAASTTVAISADDCHVLTEDVELALTAN